MRLLRLTVVPALLSLVGLLVPKARAAPPAPASSDFVGQLLAKMTLEEKLGQLTQYGAQRTPTGPKVQSGSDDDVRKGKVGSFLGVFGAEETRTLQRMAVEDSRLHIPLLFSYDVIHGFRTIFPVPLAEAASFDPNLARRTSRAASAEASAHGLHWSYAPMVDIARDARWGRVVEGAGEDPYLGAAFAAARVRGVRGLKSDGPSRMLATAKHFVAYGAAEGGRDYNAVDVTERALREVYFPPFKAAVEAGADSIMPAFNEVAGIPMTAHRELLRDVLREQWGFQGILVSDYTAIRELMMHGVAATRADAGLLSVDATIDIDMLSAIYQDDLPALVRAGKVDQKLIDASVRRVLEAKQRLGLFDDPYRYCDVERQRTSVLTASSRKLAREVASKSIVLLKNENRRLPLSKDVKTLAVIGSLATDGRSTIGPWSADGHPEETVTVLEGIRKALPKAEVLYARGAAPDSDATDGFEEAERIAKRADQVVLVLGETEAMSGEARNRTRLGLPGAQEALLDRLLKTGKPVTLLLMNGRPLAIPSVLDKAPAVLETWFLGSEHGNAVADVLFGDVNPSGKLPMTFPRSVGQVPIYYAHKRTGRPATDEVYSSKYLDVDWTPQLPFGHGLSYAQFEYEAPKLSATKIGPRDAIKVRVTVKNISQRAGDEVVQLYLRDDIASVTRPVRALRGFQRVTLAAGQAKTLVFTLDEEDYALLDGRFRRVVEPGTFTVFAGGSAAATNEAKFEVTSGAELSGPGSAIPRSMRDQPEKNGAVTKREPNGQMH